MDIANGVIAGLQVACQPINLFFAFIGVLLGTVVGVLPGLGPVATMSLLLPVTINISPVSAIIMLAGIYYGTAYGGSTTSILINIPGEAYSVITCLDGHMMARNGRAGPALGIAAFGSFIAGTLGVVGLTLIAPPLAEMALKFGPPEYFALMIAGLCLISFLASGPLWKALFMAALGVFVSSIGVDTMTGLTRFTFGTVALMDGVGFVPVVMGVFGIGEVLINLEQAMTVSILKTEIKGLLPNLKDWADSIKPILRGTLLGFFLGIMPGGGAVISSFVSYAIEKKVSKYPEKFGTGVIEGVAGPESANNSATSGAFVPLLTLGIPANAIMAMLLGALMIHGVQPGPLLLKEHSEIFWGTIASMYIGNVMLLVLNLPLIPLWVRLLKIPYRFLFPIILLLVLIGAYSVNNSIADVTITIIFGIFGYLCKKFNYDTPPFILAMVLGPMLETALRRSLLISAGSLLIFVTRPISLFLFLIPLFILFSSFMPGVKKRKIILPQEEIK